MPVLRQVVGETLRGLRLRQRRTLRDVSAQARVSLGYLSEIERGQKEASSELLAAVCDALDVRLSELFGEVASRLRRQEKLALAGRVAALPSTGTAGTAGATGLAVAVTAPLPASTTTGATGAPRVRTLPTVAA